MLIQNIRKSIFYTHTHTQFPESEGSPEKEEGNYFSLLSELLSFGTTNTTHINLTCYCCICVCVCVCVCVYDGVSGVSAALDTVYWLSAQPKD